MTRTPRVDRGPLSIDRHCTGCWGGVGMGVGGMFESPAIAKLGKRVAPL